MTKQTIESTDSIEKISKVADKILTKHKQLFEERVQVFQNPCY
jgi:hypothetical protein